MKDDQHRFLSLLSRLPSRLTVQQVAWMLNCQAHDVPVLVTSRLLKPLGNPSSNGIKFFATADVIEAMSDRNWLGKITTCISGHWQRKNRLKRDRLPPLDGVDSIAQR